MSIYDTVYFHICGNCGSLWWEEYYDWASIRLVMHEDGDYRETDREYGDLIEKRCVECEKPSIHELSVDKAEWEEIYNMNGRDRLIHIVKLMSEEEMEFDREFVDEVIEYHKNDKKFMAKISKHLQTLGYITKTTWTR